MSLLVCDNVFTFALMKLSIILFSIILTTLILFNSLRVSMTYAYYELDPIGFVEALCENKAQPELQCNGKCQLKKVSENHSTDNQRPTELIDFKEVLLYIDYIEDYDFEGLNDYKEHLFVYTNFYQHTGPNLVDHPPQV